MDEKKEIRKLNKDQFKKQCIERFGTDKLKWAFICPWCGLVQTVQDFIDLEKGYESYHDVAKIIGYDCIGCYKTENQKKRFSEIIGCYDSRKGCCLSFNMKTNFIMHSIEVQYTENKIWKVRKFFDFAS